ncbi:MAG: hypothetical protein AB4426_31585 [Xenococcaceae cyanobacterium]
MSTLQLYTKLHSNIVDQNVGARHHQHCRQNQDIYAAVPPTTFDPNLVLGYCGRMRLNLLESRAAGQQGSRKQRKQRKLGRNPQNLICHINKVNLKHELTNSIINFRGVPVEPPKEALVH